MSLFLHTLYVVGILHAYCTDTYWVLHYINILIVWFVSSRELILSSSHMQLVISWIILWTVCFSDCDNVRFNTSSYAALHRGRPPERPFNCKKPPHLGTPGLTQYSSVVCLKKKWNGYAGNWYMCLAWNCLAVFVCADKLVCKWLSFPWLSKSSWKAFCQAIVVK